MLVAGANLGIGQALVAEALRRGAGRVHEGGPRWSPPTPGRCQIDHEVIWSVADRIDRLDVLINNAGVAPRRPNRTHARHHSSLLSEVGPARQPTGPCRSPTRGPSTGDSPSNRSCWNVGPVHMELRPPFKESSMPPRPPTDSVILLVILSLIVITSGWLLIMALHYALTDTEDVGAGITISLQEGERFGLQPRSAPVTCALTPVEGEARELVTQPRGNPEVPSYTTFTAWWDGEASLTCEGTVHYAGPRYLDPGWRAIPEIVMMAVVMPVLSLVAAAAAMGILACTFALVSDAARGVIRLARRRHP